MSPPSPRRPSTTVAIRSDSFRRSSGAPRPPSRPRRSSPAARPAAARRSPAGPRPRSTRVPRAGRGRPRGRNRLGVGRAPSRGVLEVAPTMRAHPLEDPQEADPRPVARHPLDAQRASRAPARRRRRERGRGGVAGDVDGVEPSSSRLATRDRGRPRAHARRRRRRAAARCGRGSARARRRSSSPSASSPASSTHDLTCALGDRQHVLDPVQRPRDDRERREAPVARVELRAHRGERPRDPVDGPPADLSSPSSVQLPPSGCPASQPGSSRSSVPALPTSIAAPAGAAQAGAVDDEVAGRAPSTHARRARCTASSVDCVSAACEVVRDPARARLLIAPSSAARWEIDLSGGGVELAPQAGPGRKRRVHALATGRPSSATSASAWAARSAPAIHRTM